MTATARSGADFDDRIDKVLARSRGLAELWSREGAHQHEPTNPRRTDMTGRYSRSDRDHAVELVQELMANYPC